MKDDVTANTGPAVANDCAIVFNRKLLRELACTFLLYFWLAFCVASTVTSMLRGHLVENTFCLACGECAGLLLHFRSKSSGLNGAKSGILLPTFQLSVICSYVQNGSGTHSLRSCCQL